MHTRVHGCERLREDQAQEKVHDGAYGHRLGNNALLKSGHYSELRNPLTVLNKLNDYEGFSLPEMRRPMALNATLPPGSQNCLLEFCQCESQAHSQTHILTGF